MVILSLSCYYFASLVTPYSSRIKILSLHSHFVRKPLCPFACECPTLSHLQFLILQLHFKALVLVSSLCMSPHTHTPCHRFSEGQNLLPVTRCPGNSAEVSQQLIGKGVNSKRSNHWESRETVVQNRLQC